MSQAAFRLPALASLAVTGDDARDFLQNQLSADLRLVSDGRGQLAGWHDPKGRVLAFLRVLPRPEGYLLVMHAGLLETVSRRLRMFVLRAQVELTNGPPVYGAAATDLDVLLPPGTAAPTEGDSPPETLPAVVTERLSALRLPGGWLVAGELDAAATRDDPKAVAAWERAELEAGLPEIYPETSGEFVAQMINLDRIGAVSFTKGCYPGQEIVARAHHLGRVKRRAQVCELDGPPPAPGTKLEQPDGTVVRSVAADGGSLALVVVAGESDLA